MSQHGPAPYPCASCPYRKDVPSGVWSLDEYLKLPPYDNDTARQPLAAFFCHQQNGRLCAGWVGCHDMDNSLGLRMASSMGLLSLEDVEEAMSYESPVKLFATGAEAAQHGITAIEEPPPEAKRTIGKLLDRRKRRDKPT